MSKARSVRLLMHLEALFVSECANERGRERERARARERGGLCVSCVVCVCVCVNFCARVHCM